MSKPKQNASESAFGCEAKLCQMAGISRDRMDEADFKHFVHELTPLKYVSDLFEELHGEFALQVGLGADPREPDEYRAARIHAPPDAVLSL